MTQRSPYDTPADGDFVRYVETLSRPSSARPQAGSAPGEQGAAPATPLRRGRADAPGPAIAQAAALPAAEIRGRLVQLGQWGLAALVVYLMATAAFAPLAVIGVPLLLAFAVLAYLRLRPLPWAAVVAEARQRAGLHSSDLQARDRGRPPR